MKQIQEMLRVATRGRSFHDVTGDVAQVVAKSGVQTGFCVVFVQHTSASLVIQENADPAVLRDLAKWLDRLAPEASYEHDAEGPDDMPSHLKSAMTRTSETIPVTGGRLALGTWQALYLIEHRRAPHERRLVVHVTGV
ncbi:MAG TPA: secondary thiamine-phosphate synthase enzyme YjbQ [Polyangiaceae bacterium]|jgi:secondary thiamine-phosphate synthase enzyme